MRVFRGIPATPDQPIALTIGNFDGVHLGHQAMLRQLVGAASARRLPASVLTFEPHPREYFAPEKAPTRLSSLREKLELLEQHRVERTYVCRFNARFARVSAQQFIAMLHERMQVRWLLVGDDFRFGSNRDGDVELLRSAWVEAGFELAVLHDVRADGQRVSSTAVRDALATGDLARAQQLLGRRYSITGRVGHGEKLGRRLGFPTANIRIKHNRPPLSGVFAVKLHEDGHAHPAVASLGVRPTVKAGGLPLLEVYVLDFDRDLYGAHVKVEFLHKLRDEERYESLDALREQIALDVAEARRYFARAAAF